MWIKFDGRDAFALKVYIGGVNAISGESKTKSSSLTINKRRWRKLKGLTVQGYIVTHDQRWLDGVASADGEVKQFLAAPVGSGYSVEAQITGQDQIAGIQIEIIPRVRETFPPGDPFKISVKTLTGKIIPSTVRPEMPVYALKRMIFDKEHIPPDQQRLISAGKQLADDQVVGKYYIKDASPHIILIEDIAHTATGVYVPSGPQIERRRQSR